LYNILKIKITLRPSNLYLIDMGMGMSMSTLALKGNGLCFKNNTVAKLSAIIVAVLFENLLDR